jgi:hypothetical protein
MVFYLHVNRTQFHRKELQVFVFLFVKKFSAQFKVVPEEYKLVFSDLIWTKYITVI